MLISRLTDLRALLLIGFVVAGTFAAGLGNQFVGDDFAQVVSNAPVHSLSHVASYFSGSTFYDTAGQTKLSGVYFRPLMVTAAALVYALAGPNAYAFHLAQLLLWLAVSALLFAVFRTWFARGLSATLALIFAVHPINSQAVYSIADLQEPLYFGFGLLALWLSMRRSTRPRLTAIATAACLLLSMLSKETGLLFGAAVLFYAYLFNRRRLLPVAASSAVALLIYLAIKIHAVGLVQNPGNAPIDHLGLATRLLNFPAIMAFYLSKLIWPQHIAHAYYWVVRAPTLGQFWLPLALDLAIIVVLVAIGRAVHHRSQAAARVYAFFGAWFALGLFFHSQIAPLDLTISLPWFMFAFAGLLGLIGVIVQTFILPLPRRWLVAIPIAVVALLAIRTAARAPDWSATYTLAARDLAVSSEDYPSANLLSYHDSQLGQYQAALPLARQSVAVLPTADNLDTLGTAEAGLYNCTAAAAAFRRSLAIAPTATARRHLAELARACRPVEPSVK